MAKSPVSASLVWAHDLVFSATSRNQTVTVDGNSTEGASPMQLLAVAVAGCMGMDVVEILRKGRHPIEGLEISFHGTRADTPPHRFTAILLTFVVRGRVPEDAIRRAIELSRDKYCSASNSLRGDITLSTSYEVRP